MRMVRWTSQWLESSFDIDDRANMSNNIHKGRLLLHNLENVLVGKWRLVKRFKINTRHDAFHCFRKLLNRQSTLRFLAAKYATRSM